MKPGVISPAVWNVVLGVLGVIALGATQSGLVPDPNLTNILGLFGAWAIGKAQKRSGDVNSERLPSIVSSVLDSLLTKHGPPSPTP